MGWEMCLAHESFISGGRRKWTFNTGLAATDETADRLVGAPIRVVSQYPSHRHQASASSVSLEHAKNMCTLYYAKAWKIHETRIKLKLFDRQVKFRFHFARSAVAMPTSASSQSQVGFKVTAMSYPLVNTRSKFCLCVQKTTCIVRQPYPWERWHIQK